MVMPLMGGVELAGQMCQIHPETRVLFTSGYTGDQLPDAGEQALKRGFLPKPYTPDSLLGSPSSSLPPGMVSSSSEGASCCS